MFVRDALFTVSSASRCAAFDRAAKVVEMFDRINIIEYDSHNSYIDTVASDAGSGSLVVRRRVTCMRSTVWFRAGTHL